MRRYCKAHPLRHCRLQRENGVASAAELERAAAEAQRAQVAAVHMNTANLVTHTLGV